MSVYSFTSKKSTPSTVSTSILKDYSPCSRSFVKAAVNGKNKVRFDFSNRCLKDILQDTVFSDVDKAAYNEYLYMIQDSINDTDLLRILRDCKECIELLVSKYLKIVEAILSLNWTVRSTDIVNEFQDFLFDLLLIHSHYLNPIIYHLLSNWIPKECDTDKWKVGEPISDILNQSLKIIHNCVNRLLDVIPMSYNIILKTIENIFPFYSKSSFIICGFVHNIFWLINDRPIFKDDLLNLLIKRMILLDVNASRSSIESAELIDDDENQEMFDIEIEKENKTYEENEMRHQIAETLDICMVKLFQFIENEYKFATGTISKSIQYEKIYKIFINIFEKVILPTSNTHHIQYFIFYICSLKPILAEQFLKFLWEQITDPNVPQLIRQTSVGYIASLLARGKYLAVSSIKHYLLELCKWTHNYIQRCEMLRTTYDCHSNYSQKIHTMFYSVCQCIFYVIAFRIRDLSDCKKNLLFLQSLELSSIVLCQLNPLLVCIPAVATTFSAVTRKYQLAYCHVILERNARKNLAIMCLHGMSVRKPDEILSNFFPFDPYLLKKSGKRIQPLYLQYQVYDDDFHNDQDQEINLLSSRKRIESMAPCIPDSIDEIDDFIMDNKRQKKSNNDTSKSFELDVSFNYGTSPGYR